MNPAPGATAYPAEHDGAQTRVLIVDDDVGLCRDVAAYLVANGFLVETARDGSAVNALMARASFDVIILDVMMPGEDGLTLCRRLAKPGAPAIIMMSAMGEQIDRIVGLELGADDYLAKPANPRELLARIRAVLRRRRPIDGDPSGPARHYHFAGFDLDPPRRRVTAPNGLISLLTRSEMSLLTALLDANGAMLTRDQLLDSTRIDDTDGVNRAIDVQISRLRRKLGDGDGQEIIRTVRGVGYQLAAPVTRS
jgi:two-component system OmpR family response regulator